MPPRNLLFVGLGLALMSAAGAWFSLRQYQRELSGGAPTGALMVLRDLEAGAVISASDVTIREVPAAFLDNRTTLARDREKVIGLETVIPLKAQQMLQWTDLAATSETRNLSQLLAPGKRAVSVRAKTGDESGNGLIKPGDYVDVFAVVPTRYDTRSSLLLLQRVLVVAVGTSTEAAGATPAPNTKASRSESNRLLTLSLDVDETQLLVLAREQGSLSVTLRNANDARVLEAVPELRAADLVEARDRVQIRKRSASVIAPPVAGPERLREAQ